MRLYAFLVFLLFALVVRAATIPDNTQGDQERLQKSQEDFIAQIDTLTGKIQTLLYGRSNFSPADGQVKADLQIIQSDLKAFKNEFITKLKTLNDGAADQNPEEPSSDAAPVIPESRTQTFITTFQNDVQKGSADITNSISNIVIGEPNTETDMASASAEAIAPPQPANFEAAAPPQSASIEPPTPPQPVNIEAAAPPQCASVEPLTPSQPAGTQADNPPSQGGGLSFQQWISIYKPIIEKIIHQFQQITNNTNIHNTVEQVQNNISHVTQNFNPQTFIGGAGGTGGSGAPGGAGGAGASTGGTGGSSLPGVGK